MCVITTTMAAGGLAALGATALASSATAVGITSAVTSAALGAGLSAGISAATGARGRDLAMAAAIGGVGGGVASGLGMVANGITTAEILADGSTIGYNSATQAVMNGEQFVLQGAGNEAHWVAQSDLAAANAAEGGAANAAGGAGSSSNSSLGNLVLPASQLVGSGVEAYGSYREGKENAATLKEQARIADIQAQQTLDSAATESMDLARRQRQLVGKGRVAAAANGVMLESRAESSPAMWEQDAAAEAQWDRDKLFHNANTNANALFAQGNQYRRDARTARKTGNLKAVTSLIRGGANAAAGYYQSAYA